MTPVKRRIHFFHTLYPITLFLFGKDSEGVLARSQAPGHHIPQYLATFRKIKQ